MSTFVCKSMGNDCNWKHTERTEDLLLDVVAIHLRQAHGLRMLTPEEVGKVRNLIGEPMDGSGESDDRLELKEVRCADLGQNCSWHYIAQTEELITDGAAVHAREAHGIQEFTPQMIADVKKAIHPWQG